MTESNLQAYIAVAAALAVVIAVIGTYLNSYFDAATPTQHKRSE